MRQHRSAMQDNILLIPEKIDEEREALAEVWKSLGGEVRRIGKFWIKPEVDGKKVSLYGNDSFWRLRRSK